MLYREAGQFKTNYNDDQAIFPILQDRVAVFAFLAAAFLVPTLVFPLLFEPEWTEFLLHTVLIQVLVFSMAAIGLNLLTGYCGQISLGTAAFMAVGAYGSYKFATVLMPDVNIIIIILASGLISAAVGVLFGIPSFRIKGFYLAVATLAAQFFIVWLFNKVQWFYNYHSSGVIESPNISIYDIAAERTGFWSWLPSVDPEAGGVAAFLTKYFVVAGPAATAQSRYVLSLAFVVILALLAKNLVRGRIGRSWMAIRDMDIAAEIIGIKPLQTKLLAFAISSFYCGVAGAMYFLLWARTAETEAFSVNESFLILFMVIIGGLGSIMGAFLGATFIIVMPIVLREIPRIFSLPMSTALIEEIQLMIFGALIIFFLIVEPLGLARLWQLGKEKLRLWPFPY